MKKTITCNKCNGRGYFTYEQNCTDLCGVVVCRCEVCRGKGMIEVPVTNADHIRSMTDEELAELLLNGNAPVVCPNGCDECNGDCEGRMMEWLKQPYKEDA